MPTIVRKAKNGIITGGRSSGRNLSRPTTGVSKLSVSRKLYPPGMAMLKAMSWLSTSGTPMTHSSPTPVWKWASHAASFAGW